MRIGITGLAGTGKDTVADMISELTGRKKVAIAEPLHEAVVHTWGAEYLERDRKEAEQIFGESVFDWFYEFHVKLLTAFSTHSPICAEGNMAKVMTLRDVFSQRNRIMDTISPRRFMQIYGTEYWRNVYPTVFIDRVKLLYPDAVVSDVRFDNEAAICDVLVVVRRNVDAVADHVSEEYPATFADLPEGQTVLQLDGEADNPRIIWCIDNNGSLDELRQKVKQFAEIFTLN